MCGRFNEVGNSSPTSIGGEMNCQKRLHPNSEISKFLNAYKRRIDESLYRHSWAKMENCDSDTNNSVGLRHQKSHPGNW